MYYRNDIDSLFDDVVRNFFPQQDGTAKAAPREWTPSLDAWVDGDRVVLQAHLAGVDPKSVELTATGNKLTISGERPSRIPKDAKRFGFREVAYGKFSRTLELPEGTDASKAEAHFDNGVLEIRLPALGTFVPKKIEIGTQPKLAA